jgi:hypothetical protein
MRINEGKIRYIIEIASLILFLAIFFKAGLSQPGPSESSSSVAFSVELREWFVLEVSTSSEVVKSEGAAEASVTSSLNLDDNLVQIRAFASVAKNQVVELRVQALGDLMNSHGETLQASDIAWGGSGDGFLNGCLNKNGSEIMARWVGPGFHQGAVRYFYLKGVAPKGDYSQRIIYSLIAK